MKVENREIDRVARKESKGTYQTATKRATRGLYAYKALNQASNRVLSKTADSRGQQIGRALR